MEEMNRVYSLKVCEYEKIGDWDSDCSQLSRIIESYNDLYSLDSAIKFGKTIIRELCYNTIFKYIDIDEIPDDITDKQFETFISMKLNEGKSYCFYVEIISGNRKRFDTSNEIMEYFNNNIDNIPNDKLYDFLLSLVESQCITYDYNGEYCTSIINEQSPKLEGAYSPNVDFNEQDCLNGIYTFNYRGIY